MRKKTLFRRLAAVVLYCRSQARAAIGYSYGGSSEEAAQATRDEQLLAEYLGEDDGEGEDKVFSSESEYGETTL